jgi:RNase P subunit RPR2
MYCPNCKGGRAHKIKDSTGERIKQKRSTLIACSDCGYKCRVVKLSEEKNKDES